MKGVMKVYKKIMKYFEKYPTYNASVHFIGGVGIGILITYPYIGAHPVKWGLFLVTIAAIGHLLPLWMKK